VPAAQVKHIKKESNVTWNIKGAAWGAGDNSLTVSLEGDTANNVTFTKVTPNFKVTTRWFYSATTAVVGPITTPKNPKPGDPATVTYAVTVTWTAKALPVVGFLQWLIPGIPSVTTTIKITISADGSTTASAINNSNNQLHTPTVK
jgi:hypothetical protein